MSLIQLPKEIFTYEIFAYLDVHTITIMSKLDKFFHALVRDNKDTAKSVTNYSNAMKSFNDSFYQISKYGTYVDESLMHEGIDKSVLIQSMIHNLKLDDEILELKSMKSKIKDIVNYEDLDEKETFLNCVYAVSDIITYKRKQLGYPQLKQYDGTDSEEEELLKEYEEEQKNDKDITSKRITWNPSKQ